LNKLLRFLLRYSPRLVWLTVLSGALAGFCSTGLIVVINRTIANPATAADNLWFYIGLCIALPLAGVVSRMLLVHLAQKATFDLRMHLSRQILAAPLRKLESEGANKLLAALTTDVQVISQVLAGMPFFFTHLTLFVTALAYLFWVYWPAGIGILVTAVIGGGAYFLATMRAHHHLRQGRAEQDRLYHHFEAITRGTKELKLHAQRRQSFIDEPLYDTASAYRRHNVIGQGLFAVSANLGNLLFFIAIGVCLFLMPQYSEQVTAEVMTAYALVLIYLIGPIEGITNMIPALSLAAVSLNKVESLGISLKQSQRETAPPAVNSTAAFEQIVYQDITHTYHREKEDSLFTMGPMNLILQPGEVVYIVGGNGSGKTTLAKMLIGLYEPEQGQIVKDGEVIEDDNRDQFRQLFSAVFADFYLFEDLVGLKDADTEAKVAAYLERLQLQHKVKLEAGALSTTELSQGQRKRLALLTAYLEDRPIYLFDEWAADQDPLFKQVFYTVLLPELKARGKTVLAITHDDHYFHLADRIIKLDYGQIVADERKQEAVL
jgi:putative ATP-binding cassette transporter